MLARHFFGLELYNLRAPCFWSTLCEVLCAESSAAVKRESGAFEKNLNHPAAAPATVSECGCIERPLDGEVREGDAARLASPETGLAQTTDVPRGVAQEAIWRPASLIPRFRSSWLAPCGAIFLSPVCGDADRPGEIMYQKQSRNLSYPRVAFMAAVVASAFSSLVTAATDDEAAVVVSATRVSQKATSAPFASEIHTRSDIERSGAATLYEFLSQNTSIQITPAYGNVFSPKIDMRGYGIGDGYQNVVVTLDGVRLNNIDMSSPLIGAISLADVDRIEITKGSGSVMYGDGATAGTIQIKTRRPKGGRVEVSAGRYGAFSGSAAVGTSSEKYSIEASAARTSVGGYSEVDPSGHKDASSNDSWRVSGTLMPSDVLDFSLTAGGSDIDTRYAGALSEQQFDTKPGQNNGGNYTHQRFETDYWKIGSRLWLSSSLKVSVERHQEKKRSEYVSWAWISDYDYRRDDIAMQYLTEQMALTVGMQNFAGVRVGAFDSTSKENTALFLQGQAQSGDLKASLGARREKVAYVHSPVGGTSLADNHWLNAWDIGANLRVTPQLNVFSNFNSAYQAPDIDRFFNFGGTFNAFIAPARVRTLNVGLSHQSETNLFKATLFRARLKNEIYYESNTFKNTNIDQSHKYGLELHDAVQLSRAVKVSANYVYTRAIIDEENEGGGAFNGKALPGVSKHSVNFGMDCRMSDHSSFGVSYRWSGPGWAANDFDNNNVQRQRATSSMDLSYRRQMRDGVEMFAKVENLFAQANGQWIDDDAVYPANFARTWRLGLRTSF